MQVKVVTLRYVDGLNGFSDDAIRAASAGREVLEVRDHFFLHGNIPHIALVLLLGGNVPPASPMRAASRTEEDPEQSLPVSVRALYQTLRKWRNDEAKRAGIPSYAIMRNAQLAEICRRAPRTIGDLRTIDGVGEATCSRYGAALLALIPADHQPIQGDSITQPAVADTPS
jgi:superfamily II DNA helicase RecQ